jgi:hypothetical protein
VPRFATEIAFSGESPRTSSTAFLFSNGMEPTQMF